MQAISDALIGGKAVVAPSLLSSLADYYPAIEPLITKHPYDIRRAQQLLDEVGLPKGRDGFYVNPNGEPFQIEVRYTANPTHEQENAIIVDVFRRLGVNASGTLIPPIGLRDSHFLALMPGIFTSGARGHEQDMGRYTTAEIPRPETRWQGFNRGAWSNAEYDRLWDAYNTTLDRPQRIQQLAQMEKIFTEELPAIPHYYTPVVAAHVGALSGPAARNNYDAVEVVHVHRWEWRS